MEKRLEKWICRQLQIRVSGRERESLERAVAMEKVRWYILSREEQ